MVEHAQRAQRLDQGHLAKIEISELGVALQQLAPLAALIRPGARQEHPQVLDARPGGAIVQVDEGRPLLIPQQVAEVTVPMQADFPQRRGLLEGGLHPSQKCFARIDITLAQHFGQQRRRQHLVAGIDP